MMDERLEGQFGDASIIGALGKWDLFVSNQESMNKLLRVLYEL